MGFEEGEWRIGRRADLLIQEQGLSTATTGGPPDVPSVERSDDGSLVEW